LDILRILRFSNLDFWSVWCRWGFFFHVCRLFVLRFLESWLQRSSCCWVVSQSEVKLLLSSFSIRGQAAVEWFLNQRSSCCWVVSQSEVKLLLSSFSIWPQFSSESNIYPHPLFKLHAYGYYKTYSTCLRYNWCWFCKLITKWTRNAT
jgi:hypothetical protein